MASPFTVFRKHQKTLLVWLGLMAMISFVVLPIVLQNMGARQSSNPVVVTTDNYGRLTRHQIGIMQQNRQALVRFLQRVTQEVAQAGGNFQKVQFLARAFQNPTPEAVVETWLLAKRAQEMGVVISPAAVNQFLAEITTSEKITSEQVQGILAEMKMSVGQLFRLLETELLALRMQELFTTSLAGETPAQRWAYYKRLNEKATIEVVAIPVADFTEKVKDPDESTLREFFEHYRDRLPDPSSPEPGFRVPKKLALEYLKGQAETIVDAASIPLEEVRAEYDRVKDQIYRREALPSDQPAAPAADSMPPAEPAGGSQTPVDQPPAEQPAAEQPAAEQPAAEQPAAEQPAAEQAGTSPPDEAPPAEQMPAEEAPAETTPPDEPPAPAEPAPSESDQPAAAESSAEPTVDAGNEPAGDPAMTPVEGEQAPADAPPSGDSAPDSAESASPSEPPAPVDSDSPAETDSPKPDDGAQTSTRTPFRLTALLQESAGEPAEETPSAPAEQPTANPSASEQPTAAAPAGQDPANPSEESVPASPDSTDPAPAAPESTDPAPAAPERTDNATPAEAAPAEGAAEPSYMPFEQVEQEIRRRLVRERAERVLGEVQAVLEQYRSEWRQYQALSEQQRNAQPAPARPDFDALAKKHNLTAHQIPLSAPHEVRSHDIGVSMIDGQISFIDHAYESSAPFAPAISMDDQGNYYLFWKTEETEEKTPEFDDIRDEVLRTWKQVEARQLALNEAERLAEEVRQKKQSLGEHFGDRAFRSEPFSWMTYGAYAGWWQRLPEVSAIYVQGQTGQTGIPAPGDEFMSAVFNLEPGQIGAALDQPKNAAYVIRVLEFNPSAEALRQQFLAASDPFSYQGVAQYERRQAYEKWLDDLKAEVGFEQRYAAEE